MKNDDEVQYINDEIYITRPIFLINGWNLSHPSLSSVQTKR